MKRFMTLTALLALSEPVLASAPTFSAPAHRVGLERLTQVGSTLTLDWPWSHLEIVQIVDSPSMLPVLAGGNQVILARYNSSDFVQVGDIILYTIMRDDMGGMARIIHAVVEIGYDTEWYCIAQGYNNPGPDPLKVRYNQIIGYALGVFW